MKVTVYSTTTCPYCKMLKEYLEEKGVDYDEKLVDQDDTAKEQMQGVSGGFLGVPFVVVTKEDGSKHTILGFDKGKLASVIG
ncbi:glutaredoxin family protein [Patescibacteria group bacterium]